MHQDDREIGGVSSPDHDSALCEQQTVLLNRINLLTRDATINNTPKSRGIYTLKQEYNRLVNKRAELARTPLLDPMEVLPPDLWPDIIGNIDDGHGYPVEKLLDLMSVSKGWCSVLTTLPVIWTDIRLDQREPDYLAKAMMCIQLSGECEINLNILRLTADEWRGISSMIVPEGRRIRRLSFILRDTDFMVIRQVLGDFTKLPVLQELSLPRTPRQLSDQQHIHTLLTEKMPSIKMVDTSWCTMRDQIWNSYLTKCTLEAESLTKEAVETLILLPHLRHLNFVETAQTMENAPSLLKSSFGSVTTFGYSGTDICRRLSWIGNNLSTLSTQYPENGDTIAFFVALSRFPRLHELIVTVMSTTWRQPTQNIRHTPTPHNSIRVLSLEAPIQDTDWDVLFSIFFAASPRLENLSVKYGLITDMGWSSIQSIKNLRYLYIFMCSIGDSPSIPLNMESLRQFELSVSSHGFAQFLARLQSKFLQTLRLTENQTHLPAVTTTPYIIAGAAFPNITSLILSTESLAIWELGALSKLRELVLTANAYTLANHRIHWVSDVLEAILMRPRDNPALERITLICDFVEWDTLILMLERRNFLNEPGISSIKTLVINHDLPYRLLYPLSELLGGRFVERGSNQSFSLDAIGERMWNESIAGCMKCHYSLRECDSLFTPFGGMDFGEAAGGDKECPLPNEYLAADPQLPPEMTLWISGRRERQIRFLQRYEETRHPVHRPWHCNACKSPFESWPAITGDTLVGAHFGDDDQEQNEVSERVYVDSTEYS